MSKHADTRWPKAESPYACTACREGEHAKCSPIVLLIGGDESPCDCYLASKQEHEQARDERLGEWLYRRFRPYNTPWAEFSQDDRDYWAHEARAVRRAVERGGFKDYDPEMSKL